MNEVPEEQRQQQELSRLVPDVPSLVVRCVIYISCKIYNSFNALSVVSIIPIILYLFYSCGSSCRTEKAHTPPNKEVMSSSPTEPSPFLFCILELSVQKPEFNDICPTINMSLHLLDNRVFKTLYKKNLVW